MYTHKYDIDALVKKNKQLMDENVTLKDNGLQKLEGKKTICKTRQQKDIQSILADLKTSLAKLQKYADEGSMVS
ncbi:hypothetical protein CHS0354_017235 [Potamilus streckersoni]|uniref:Uncharacterized protein n=1 Tax=Potamilus streckersoni TaxID=2493646 RepID=A0AAE0SIA3_9BIVA|nr:hypothetical protein CHS0354_017235 [Potamilus streckersoni]